MAQAVEALEGAQAAFPALLRGAGLAARPDCRDAPRAQTLRVMAPIKVPATGRAVTLARQGMVTSPHTLASQAGLSILKSGGTAVDAAIAANAVLGVVYPHMCGIGGDAFWLIYSPRERRVYGLNASGRAPAAASIQFFRDRGMASIPLTGLLSVSVPGNVDGWFEAHARFGRLPMAKLLEEAVGYAREGFPVAAGIPWWIQGARDELRRHPDSAAMYLPNGEAPRAGEVWVHANLARSLDAIAQGGRDAFYRGNIAAALAAFCRANGGLITEADLAAHRSQWQEPVASSYRGVTIFQTAPNSQGLAALLALNILEGWEVGRLGFLSPESVHRQVEAIKLAFADRDRYIADPDFVDVPVAALLSKDYAGRRRALADPRRAAALDHVPTGDARGDTINLCTVDPEGNAVSLIQSLYFGFGSGVVAGDTGILLHNRGAYFSLDPDHANRIEPRKRPLHTLMASMAFRDETPFLLFGTMGADGQPQFHLQVYSALLDFGLDLQQAIEAPRWISGRFGLGEARETLRIESRFPAETTECLRRLGHPVDIVGAWSQYMGHAHGIMFGEDGALKLGGADPRADGAALGY